MIANLALDHGECVVSVCVTLAYYGNLYLQSPDPA